MRMRWWWAAMALMVPAAAAAQIAPDAALARDADTYAAVAGLGADEALVQLRLQQAGAPVSAELAAEFEARFAGISVEHRPAYRLVVALTGDDPVPDRVAASEAGPIAVTFRTGAGATRTALLAALTGRQAAIRAALAHPPGMGIDPRDGTLAVLVSPADAAAEPPVAMAARLSAVAGVPVAIRVLGQEANLSVEGGARVVGIDPTDGRRYACTTGFTVTDGTRDGVVTAAHCPDDLSYVDGAGGSVPLRFVGQWGWGFQDVQVHASAAPLAPDFYADTAKTERRAVTAAAPRAATRAGDVVCHRGERTGYSCAEVELTDFAPAGDLCGGACLPSWVAVRGPSCKGGDSGGPVFLGSVAYGIVKGGSYRRDGRCGFYYYMSVDYLPEGWRLLEAAPVPATDQLASARP